MGYARAVETVAASGTHPAADSPASPGSLLRFITCGSVDDGKSTLIGRMLHEAGAIPSDTLAALERDSRRFGTNGGALDFALLVDGLAAEREQGITIDVAHRYFATPRRAFIVADTPGHEQYTRNMATGASGADLAIILVDAGKGLLDQTRRHSIIVALAGVRHVVVAINKMDLIGFDEARFRAIEADYRAAARGFGFVSLVFIPVSAREGDNVAAPSPRMPWYRGPALLDWLERIEIRPVTVEAGFALPVQYVNRPDAGFRGFAGTIAAGRARPGDPVLALPSGRRGTIARIVTFDGDRAEAGTGEAVTLTLAEEIDIARGDVIVAAAAPEANGIRVADRLVVRLLVTAERALRPGERFQLQLGTAMAHATIVTIDERTDVATLAHGPAEALAMNDLGTVTLRLDRPLALAPFRTLRDLGSLILVDRLTNATAAMGTVTEARMAGDAAGAQPAGRLAALRASLTPAGTARLAGAGLVALLVLGLTGAPLAAGLAGLGDLVLRPLAERANRALWTRHAARRDMAAPELSDGGGI
jgi:sulfate adenylyltransferase large subunit